MHELSVAAIRSQESRAEAESEARSRLCLHDSCNTSFRQRPKVRPARRGKYQSSKVRPTIAATSSRPRVWWRPAAGVLEIAQSRPSQLCSHGCPPVSALSACLDTATMPSRMTLLFEKARAVLATGCEELLHGVFQLLLDQTSECAAYRSQIAPSLSSMPCYRTVANSPKRYTCTW